MVASFAASVLYWRATHAPWPPPGLDLPSPWLPGLGAALLLLSCLSMWGAGRALGRDEVSRCVGLIVTSLLLASATLALRGWQFTQFGYRWDAHPWGSLLWTLSGFHFVHVVSAVIGTAVVALLGAMGYFSRRRQLAVVVDSLYWYFVAVAWLPLYAVLYGVPRWT